MDVCRRESLLKHFRSIFVAQNIPDAEAFGVTWKTLGLTLFAHNFEVKVM